MKTIALITLLTFHNQGSAYISMDNETLVEGQVATLIYVLGCGEWENFTFSVNGNQLNASADVPDSWFTCHIDPAPPQFWNRLPLAQLPVGDYQLNLTLIGPMQNSNTTQLNFVIGGGIQSVPVNGLAALILLALMMASFGVFQPRKLQSQKRDF